MTLFSELRYFDSVCTSDRVPARSHDNRLIYYLYTHGRECMYVEITTYSQRGVLWCRKGTRNNI